MATWPSSVPRKYGFPVYPLSNAQHRAFAEYVAECQREARRSVERKAFSEWPEEREPVRGVANHTKPKGSTAKAPWET